MPDPMFCGRSDLWSLKLRHHCCLGRELRYHLAKGLLLAWFHLPQRGSNVSSLQVKALLKLIRGLVYPSCEITSKRDASRLKPAPNKPWHIVWLWLPPSNHPNAAAAGMELLLRFPPVFPRSFALISPHGHEAEGSLLPSLLPNFGVLARLHLAGA